MDILIVDDHAILRQGLRSLLEQQVDMDVVGEAEDGKGAIHLAEQLRPDVIIMDVTMPKLNGIDATRHVAQQYPNIKTIVLSMHAEGHIVREAMDAGAMGYVLKSYQLDELIRALHAVADDEHYLSSRITEVLVHDWLKSDRRKAGQPPEELTSRERQILQLTSEGRSVKEIALNLHISSKTVHGNRRALMDKLGVSSAAELTKYAISCGLTSIEF